VSQCVRSILWARLTFQRAPVPSLLAGPVLQCVAVCCSVLLCVAVNCNTWQCNGECCRSLQYVSVLQCAAVQDSDSRSAALFGVRVRGFRV